MAKAKDTCLGCLLMAGLAVGGFVMFMNWATAPLTPEQQAAKEKAQADQAEEKRLAHNAKVAKRAVTHSKEKQAARDTIIQELLDRGVFLKVEPRQTAVDLYVQPAFHLLNIDDKSNFVGVVFARYLDEDDWGHHVNIKDGLSGKDIGEFTARGLEMY